MALYDNCSLGIELGSTRIKSVLIDDRKAIIASGSYTWENSYENGIWTYSLDAVESGLRASFAALKKDYESKFNETLKRVKAIGISAMMHGYLAFDDEWRLLTPFRTWRCTITEKESAELTELFEYPIPERWTISHLLYDIKRDKEYLLKIRHVTTLASYVHYLLTGINAIGLDDASGMFPVDSSTYKEEAVSLFKAKYGYDVRTLFPKVYRAGSIAGALTEDGARLLDESGELEAGIPFAPPEGDAGTGMAATNAIKPGRANVSAGTSAFLMVVLSEKLSRPYKELDIVATPDGYPVAMAHVNNCTGDLDSWIGLIREALSAFGLDIKKSDVYSKLYELSNEADKDVGNITAYNFQSGEPIADVRAGVPLLMKGESSAFKLSNFMKANLYSAIASLRFGLDILIEENIAIDSVQGHGGYFKSNEGKVAMSAALKSPVITSEASGEGGAWGMALLADYLSYSSRMSLAEYLDNEVFSSVKSEKTFASDRNVEAFDAYYERYKKRMGVEKEAGNV